MAHIPPARAGLLDVPVLAAIVVASLVFRFWLGWVTPVTGDEAYFIWWGFAPDWGYYDHPPMIGWWLAALSALGDSALLLRVATILQPLLLALAIAWAAPRLWPGIEPARRNALFLLVLLAPANVWNVFVTTDTPLVYFSVLSGLAWLRAVQRRPGDGWGWFVLCGVLLAGAVLSKYFVALLGFAYLVDTARLRRRGIWAGLFVTYAMCVPALALMAWWNAGHCWPNYMFNFVNRNADAAFSWVTPLLYAATLLYVFSPPAAWLAVRRTLDPLPAGPPADPADAVDVMRRPATTVVSLVVLAGVPLLLFGLLSGPKTIGLHWLLSFVPFVVIWVALRVPLPTLRRLGVFFVGFAVLHVVAAFVMAQLPLETWRKQRIYPSAVLTVDGAGIAAALAADLADAQKNWVPAMDGYSNAITLAWNLKRYVMVFGLGSSHARHDDIMTDVRSLDGRNLLILRKTAPEAGYYQPYFRRSRVQTIEVRGATFWLIRGEGFDYARYREEVLREVRRRYYQLPAWLPQRGCYFCDRYFPGESCTK